MADLRREGDELVLELTAFEKAESVHGDIRVPAAAIRSIEIVNDAMGALHGVRAPGTGVPGVIAVGTWRTAREKQFAVLHHDTHRAVRVVLEGAEWNELLVGSHDPEAVVAELTRT